MQSATFQPSQLLNHRYSVAEVISRSEFEVIYLAQDSQNSDELCTIHQLISTTPDAINQVYNCYRIELNQLKTLRHPNIEALKDTFVVENCFYWVKESLGKQSYRSQPPMSESELIQWLKPSLLTLSYLHNRNVTHRNFAPENVLVSAGDHSPILTNFGVFEDIRKALKIVPNEMTLLDRTKQFPIHSPTTAIAEDLYGLGLTAALLLTGKDLVTLFNSQLCSWDWEQWKCLSDTATQVLNRLLSTQSGFHTANEAYQLLSAPTQVMSPYPSPQPTHFQPNGIPTQKMQPVAYPANQEGSKAWLAALGGGVFLTLAGIVGIVLVRGNEQLPTAIAPAPQLSPSPTVIVSNQASSQPSQPPTTSTAQPTPSPVATPQATAPQTTTPAQTPTTSFAAPSTPSSTNSSSPASPTQLSESDAVNLVKNWLQAKKTVFASPFDRQVAANLTTGALYYDITKSGGSIDWLKGNNAYYQFGSQSVESTGSFSAISNQATVGLKVTEDRTFYVDGKVDAAQTDFKTKTVVYTLQLENGTWKIADYK